MCPQSNWPPCGACMTWDVRRLHRQGWTQLALLLALCLHGALAGFYEITGETKLVGPGDSGTQFSDINLLLDQGPLTEIGFNSSLAANAAGIALWYGRTKVVHGTYVKDLISQKLDSGITEVRVEWIEGDEKRKGRFTTFYFSNDEETYQFGMMYMDAKSATFKAPKGSFLGALAGVAAQDNLEKLKFIWAKRSTQAYAEYAGVSATYSFGPKTGGADFDDTSLALKNPDVSSMAWSLPSGPGSGVEVVYGARPVAHAIPIKSQDRRAFHSRITKVEGSYMQSTSSQPGRLCHVVFKGRDVYKQFGTPCTGGQTFQLQAPRGNWLGALKGYATPTDLREITFVWFKERDHGTNL